jgi:rhamnulokinase
MPAAPAYLAFDLGASSGRAVLGTLEDGRMTMDELHRFPTPLVEAGERLYWDVEALWDELREGLRLALGAAPHLRSLSVDSWGVDYVPLDAEGRALRDPYCYRDPRTDGMMARAFERVPASELYAVTGIQFLPINTLYQVLADHVLEPDLVSRTATRLLMADYCLYRFCGRAAAEVSLASTTGLVNARGRTWDAALMQRLALEPGRWPEVLPAGTILGPLSHALGPEGAALRVVAGCSHDTAAAVAAVPADEDGPAWAYLSSGTWSLLGAECPAPILHHAAFEASFTNEAGLDGTIRFLKNLTGLWVLQECERAWKEDGASYIYDGLLREAEAALPEALPPEALLDLDDPRFAARGDMPETIRSYQHERGRPVPRTRGHFVRLILESLSNAYGARLRLLDDLTGRRTRVLHIVGGGAQNELLCRMTAEACRCTVVAGPAEATALGNLLIQARTLGDLPPGDSIRDVVRRSTRLRTYEPRA